MNTINLSLFLNSLFFCWRFVAFCRFFVAFLPVFCRFFWLKKTQLQVEKRYLHFENYINLGKNPVSRVQSGKMSFSGTKVKEFLPKRQNFRSKNHKIFQKKTKNRQISDKKTTSCRFFKFPAVALCRLPKMRQKSDKMRQFVAFSFVAAHPSSIILIFFPLFSFLTLTGLIFLHLHTENYQPRA